MRTSTRLIGTAVAVVAALSIAGGVAAGSTVVVRPGDVGASWLGSTRPGGAFSLVSGPAAAPLGIGSLQFTTSDVHASAELFSYSYVGKPLADFDALSYDAYRVSSSTNPKEQTIALALTVDVNGPDVAAGYATLIFEPDYQSGGNGAMKTDTWQTWDAYQGGNAIWWATKSIPGAPDAFNSFVKWSKILAENPQATIAGGVGLFIGSGWAGQFTGFGDALKIGVGGNSATYNFEPATPLTITAPEVARAQGAADPAFSPGYAGFLYGDTSASLTTQPTCTTSATTASPVGTYPITCSGAASGNYDIAYVPGALHVTEAVTVAPSVEPTEAVGGETGAPVRAATLPPTSASNGPASGGDSTPLVALMVCLAFGAIGLVGVQSQRRKLRG